MSLSVLFRVTPPSELVAETDTGIEGRGLVGAERVGDVGVAGRGCGKAVSQTVLHLRPHHTGVHVDVPGKAPIDHQRDSVQRAGALGRGNAVSGTLRERRSACRKLVLPLVVIGTGDVERRRDRIPHADPGRLKDLVRRERRVVRSSDNEPTRIEGTRCKWVIRVGVIDVLVTTEQFPRSDRVPGPNLEHGVVGDRGRDLAVARRQDRARQPVGPE